MLGGKEGLRLAPALESPRLAKVFLRPGDSMTHSHELSQCNSSVQGVAVIVETHDPPLLRELCGHEDTITTAPAAQVKSERPGAMACSSSSSSFVVVTDSIGLCGRSFTWKQLFFQHTLHHRSKEGTRAPTRSRRGSGRGGHSETLQILCIAHPMTTSHTPPPGFENFGCAFQVFIRRCTEREGSLEGCR